MIAAVNRQAAIARSSQARLGALSFCKEIGGNGGGTWSGKPGGLNPIFPVFFKIMRSAPAAAATHPSGFQTLRNQLAGNKFTRCGFLNAARSDVFRIENESGFAGR